MNKRPWILACLLTLCSAPLYEAPAQDERFLRELLSERFYDPNIKEGASSQYFHVVSPFYEIDLDGNGRNESLIFEKIDGKDLFHIQDYEGKRLFTAGLTPLGTRSHLFKINFRHIGDGLKVLLLHYYEGYQNYLEFMGTSRLYMVTFKDLRPGSFNFSKGPLLWTEYKDHRENYIQRGQHVVVHDFDKDGVKEISVRYKEINRVFKYRSGEWVGFN